MAPLPVIAGVYRITVNWQSSNAVNPVNVFHIFTASTDVTEIGDELEDAMGGTTNNQWAPISNSYTIDSLDILPLDGSSVTANHPMAGSIPGDTTGETLPAVCAVISFKTQQRGPRGRGRLYLGPMGESGASNGLIDATPRLNSISGWQDFAEAISTGPLNADLVVASYTHEEFNTVDSISMRLQLGTQRRRQNQLV